MAMPANKPAAACPAWADKGLNVDVWLGIKTENSVCLTLSEWPCPAQKRVLTRKYVKNDAFYNLLLISELVVSVALIVSPLCLKVCFYVAKAYLLQVERARFAV